MINTETELRLAQFFFALASGQQTVELARQHLASDAYFEPFSAFRYLDRQNQGSLSCQDIQIFLDSKGISSNQAQVNKLIKQYDSNLDGRLSLNQFSRLVLPCLNQDLREEVCSRLPTRLVDSTVRNLIQLLIKELQFHKELEHQREELYSIPDLNLLECFRSLDQHSNGFLSRADFLFFMGRQKFEVDDNHINSIFRRIDMDGDQLISYFQFVEGVLKGDQLQKWKITGNNSRASFGNLQSVSPLRNRIEDESIDYVLQENLRVKSRRSPLRNASPLRMSPSLYSSPRRSPLRNQSPQENSTIRSSSRLIMSPQRSLSPIGTSNMSPHRMSPRKQKDYRMVSRSPSPPKQQIPTRYLTPVRSSIVRRLSPAPKWVTPSKRRNYFNAVRKNDIIGELTDREIFQSYESKQSFGSKYSPSRSYYQQVSIRPESRSSYSQNSNYGQEEILAHLYENIQISRQIETNLIRLCSQNDFNLEDAFKIFDNYDRGFITYLDIQEALEVFQISMTEHEFFLLIRHYSKNQGAKLTFQDFSEILKPKDSQLVRILLARYPQNVDFHSRRQVFSPQTTQILIQTFQSILNSQRISEQSRLRLSQKPHFNPHQAFRSLDLNYRGFLTIQDFHTFLSRNSIEVTQNDLQFLMSRYDHSRDGRVNFSDFIQEVTPKLPKTYQLMYLFKIMLAIFYGLCSDNSGLEVQNYE